MRWRKLTKPPIAISSRARISQPMKATGVKVANTLAKSTVIPMIAWGATDPAPPYSQRSQEGRGRVSIVSIMADIPSPNTRS